MEIGKPVLDVSDRIRVENRDGDCDGRALGTMVGNYSWTTTEHSSAKKGLGLTIGPCRNHARHSKLTDRKLEDS